MTVFLLAASLSCESATAPPAEEGPANTPPTAPDVSAETPKNTPLEAELPATDADGDALTFEVVDGPSHGTVEEVSSTGDVITARYTPETGFSGEDSFTYTVSDGEATSDPGTVTITVVNGVPVAEAAETETAKGRAVVIELAAADPDGDALTFEVVDVPTGGTLEEIEQPEAGANGASAGGADQGSKAKAGGTGSASAEGSTSDRVVARVTYTPASGFDGGDGFTFRASDGTDVSEPATVTVVVVNGAPAAQDVEARTAKGEAVEVELAGTDPDGDALTLEIVDGPANGEVGAPEVVETAAVSGADASASEASAPSATSGPSDAGAAPGGGQASTSTAASTAAAETRGVVTYTPGAGFDGTDTFTYTVSDGTTTSEPATATVTVQNGTPVAEAASVATRPGTAVEIGLEGSDPDGDALSFEIKKAPEHGTLGPVEKTGATTATVEYTPADGFVGEDAFQYRVLDGTDASARATVDVAVTNGAPTATGRSVSTRRNAPLTITLEGSDPDGDVLHFLLDAPEHGSLGEPERTGPSSAEVTYTPSTGFIGGDAFTFRVTDTNATSDRATVSITVTNTGPTADAKSVSLAEDAGATTLGLTGSDPEGDALSFGIASGPSSGTLGPVISTGTESASVDYTPDADFFGTDSFDFSVSDGSGSSATATVTITVTAVNDPPSFTKGADATVLEDAGAQTVGGWATAISAGPGESFGAGAGFSVTGNTNTGLFSSGPAISLDGTLSYTPAADANGSADITVELADGDGATSGSATFTITVDAVNDAPSFTKGSDVTVAEDSGPYSESDWATGFDPGPADESGQSVASYNVTNDDNALFSAQPAVAADGTLTFTPAPDANGSATVTVSVTDDGGTADGGTDTSPGQTFTITVTAVNDPPALVSSPSESFTTAGNTTLQVAASKTVTPAVFVSGNLLDNFTDVDGDALTASLEAGSVTAGADVTVNADGTFTYTPPVGRTADDTFDYTVTDGTDAVTRTVTISIDEMVWYVDNTGGSDGRSSDPFVSPLDAAAAAGVGDIIFIDAGDGTTLDLGVGKSVELKDDQRLIGEAAGLSLPGLGEIVPAGARPVLGVESDGETVLFGVDLATDNEVRGIEIDASTDAFTFGIGGTSGSGGTIDDVVVDGGSQSLRLSSWSGTVSIMSTTLTGGGRGLSVVKGAPTVSFEGTIRQESSGRQLVVVAETTGGSVTVSPASGGEITGDPGKGIEITDAAGDVTVTGARITGGGDGAGEAAVSIIGGTGTFTFNDLDVDASVNEAVKITGGSTATVNVNLASSSITHSDAAPVVAIDGFGGTATFTGGPIEVTGGGGGISLSGNTGGTIDFRNTLTLATGSSEAIDVSGAGTVKVADVTVTSASTGIDLTGASGSFTASGTTSISGATGAGILLGAGAGSATFQGPVTVTGAGAAGIDIDDGSATFSGVTTVSSPGGAGIDIDGAGGPLSFGAVTIGSRSGVGIDIDGTGTDIDFGAVTIANPNASTAPAIAVDGTTAGTVTFDGGHLIDGAGAGSGTDALVGFALSSSNAGIIEWSGGTIKDAGARLVRSTHAAKVRMTDVTLDGGTFGVFIGSGEWDLSGLTVTGIGRNGVTARGSPIVRITDSAFDETGLASSVAPAVTMESVTDGHLVLDGLTFGTRDRAVEVELLFGFDAACVVLANLSPTEPFKFAEYRLEALDFFTELELEPVVDVGGTIDKTGPGIHTDVLADTCTRPSF